jgi:SDR family mycofactocin-dependent oxidoreductase
MRTRWPGWPGWPPGPARDVPFKIPDKITAKGHNEVTGKLEGKVVFITGAARGQGRSHAVRLAQEGADIIAVDICRQIESVDYPMATPEDLDQTVKEVEALDRRIFARQADVRDEAGLKAAFDAGVAELGPVDIVLANAGIAPMSMHEIHQAWQDVIDVNLTGVFNTVETAIPSMIERGTGGAIVLTSSTAGINGIGGATRGGLGYTAAKHGVVGLMRSYANTLAPHNIRVNSVHPTGVRTPMVVNDVMAEFLAADPSLSNAMANALPVDMVEPVDISNAILWLVSDDARYVTGVTLPVDAGFTNKK